MKSLLLVLAATSYRADAFAAAAERLGVELTLATDQPGAFRRFARPALAIDLADPRGAAELVERGGERFDGVLGTDEPSALAAAWIAKGLGLPAADPDGAQAARDKRHMRERLAADGVPGPRVAVLEPGDDARALAGRVRFPCVVKPPMLTGSQGVIRADDAAELERAVLRTRRILASHPSPWRAERDFHRLLVEDYIDGPEVAVEALMHGGRLEPLALFEKPDALEGPFFEETLYVTPSRHASSLQTEIFAVAERAARALGLAHGPVHVELRLARSGPEIVELAARSIGGLCSHTFELAAGSLEERLVAHAVGLPAPARAARAPAAGVMMIPIPKSGVLKRVHGLDVARAIPGVDRVTIALQPGDAVRALPEGASYLGFIFARGDAPERVERALRAAHAALEFELSPLLELA
jgi:biotin carboxylase